MHDEGPVPKTGAATGPEGARRVGPVLGLVAALVALRVLGISALLPVLSLYGFTLPDRGLFIGLETSILVGLAFGGYGLTMAIMQVPMGVLSDRYGRRNLLLLGLALFITGNLVAGSARTLELLILGRLIEGTGAISAVALALATDTLPAAKRTVGLAIAGIAAGTAFLVGVAVGPVAASLIGVSGIFYASATLGLVMFAAVATIVPGGAPAEVGPRGSVLATLRDPRGLSLDVGSFALYFTLTATLYALPLLWVESPGGRMGPITEGSYRQLLIWAVLLGGITAIALARVADKRSAAHTFSVIGFILLGLSAAGLLRLPPETFPFVLLGVVGFLYIASHGLLSATLPSLVGAHFPAHVRGAAMGGLATTQYLGSFTGGLAGGFLWAHPPALPFAVATVPIVAAVALTASAWRGRKMAAEN